MHRGSPYDGRRPRVPLGVVAVTDGKGAREYAKGHRERLRGGYRRSGEPAPQDYELLELVLTYAIPRRDTKLLANRLSEGFATLARLFEADPATLEQVEGIVVLDGCRLRMGRLAGHQRSNGRIPRGC